MQPEFCREVLKRCREEGIHTCVESALHVSPVAIDRVAPFTQLFITDIKQMDTDVHKRFTGVGNQLILSNIRKLVDMDMPLIIRMPIIPGFNDNTAYIDATSDFILNALHNKPLQIQLLKYRPLGEEKAETLGLPMEMKALRIENREEFEARIRGYVRRMNERGIPAIPGSRGKPETRPQGGLSMTFRPVQTVGAIPLPRKKRNNYHEFCTNHAHHRASQDVYRSGQQPNGG